MNDRLEPKGPRTDERRGNPRMVRQLDVSLHFNSLMLLNCQTRDVSLEGVYVDTGGEILPHNADIDLGLSVEIDGETLQHRMPARVARVDESGVGLNFQFTDYQSFAALVALLDVA